jgi:anti-anti-sigma regulatory factor
VDPSRWTQFAVEDAGPTTVLVRVAGELSGAAGVRLAALVDRRAPARVVPASGARRVVVDLGAVRSFDADGVEPLRRAGLRLGEAGVSLLLTGLDGRRGLLPGRVDAALDAFGVLDGPEDAPAAGTG